MSKIEGGNLLANLRQVNTAQPVSDLKKAEAAKEASQIQPIQTQPTVEKEVSSYDELSKSYDGGEMDSEAAKKLQEEYREAMLTKKAQVEDAKTIDAGGNSPGNIIVEDNTIATSSTVAREEVATVASLTAQMVEGTVYSTSDPKETVESQLAHEFSTTKVDLIRDEIDHYSIDPSDKPQPKTEFQEQMANPIHQKSSHDVNIYMQDYESPILFPEEVSQLDMTPEKEYTPPVASQNESTELIDNETRNDAYILREQRWEDTVTETLIHEANLQKEAAEIASQPSIEPTQGQIQAAAAVAQAKPDVAQVENTQENPQAVETISAVNKAQTVAPVESTVDETLPEVRPELQSGTAKANVEATTQKNAETTDFELPEYEMPELDLPGSEPVAVDAQQSAVQVTETPEFEPQLIETGSQIEETAAQTSQLAQEELSTTDYFPDLPGTSPSEESYAVDMGSDANQAEALFASGTQSSSAQHIQDANQKAQIAEDIDRANPVEHEPIPVETEPEISHNVQILSDEELNLLRTGAMNHTVDTQEIPMEPTYEIPETSVANESWVTDAMNYNTSERYSVQLSHGEVDLTEFEENFVKEEPTTLEDFDYSLVANRISEAAATIVPQEVFNSFGS